MDTYVYEYGSGLYVNLTNRCNNNCAFCLRHTNQGVGRHRLWLEHEPTAEQVIEKMQNLSAYEEVVFCGFGEPTLAWETLKQVAAYVKRQGKPVRVNKMYIRDRRMGAEVSVSGRTAIFQGVEALSGADVVASDLRAGACLVIAGLMAGGETRITGLKHIDRGYDHLEDKLRCLGAEIRRDVYKRQYSAYGFE